jgi:hypothetical protein
MRNARSWKVIAVVCILVGLASFQLASALASGDNVAKQSNPGSPYRLVSSVNAAGDNWFAYRINKVTGETWKIPDAGWSWSKFAEPGQIPNGDYDLQIMVTGSGNSAIAQLIRMERKTGLSWYINNGTWTPMTESK